MTGLDLYLFLRWRTAGHFALSEKFSRGRAQGVVTLNSGFAALAAMWKIHSRLVAPTKSFGSVAESFAAEAAPTYLFGSVTDSFAAEAAPTYLFGSVAESFAAEAAPTKPLSIVGIHSRLVAACRLQECLGD